MSKRIKIFPYNLGSESARSLARELETVCVKPDGKYRPYPNHLIVNWGNSRSPTTWHMDAVEVLNHPNFVADAVNKLRTLEILRTVGVPTPEWTTDREVALEWESEGETIFERHSLTGSKGDGIRVVADHSHEEGITNAPLYTKAIVKAREYRVHVFDGEVIDIQQKKRREGNDSDGTIKNLDNGWVFVRDGITRPPSDIFDIAIRAVEALGLDFGGVDILTKDGECYVLEVNCAIGIEGSTLTTWTNAIKRYANI